MEILLDIYYLLKTSKDDRLIPDDFRYKLVDLCGLTIPNFYPCIIYDGEDAIQYRYTDALFFRADYLRYFLHFMDILHKECTTESYHHFDIAGYDYEVHNVNDATDLHFPSRRKDLEAMYRIPSAEHHINCVQQEKVWGSAIDQWNMDMLMKEAKEEVKELFSRVEYSPVRHERFRVLGISEFGKLLRIPIPEKHGWKLEMTFVRDHPEDYPEDIPIIIKSPGHPDSRTFIQFVQAFFVKYQAVFGSFDRLRVCKYKPCSKLFHAGRLGREFCGNQCRMRHNAECQPKAARLCRERQNNWLRYWVNSRKIKYSLTPVPDHVQKSDCMDCPKQVRTGQCPVLQKRNKKMFAELKGQRLP